MTGGLVLPAVESFRGQGTGSVLLLSVRLRQRIVRGQGYSLILDAARLGALSLIGEPG